MNEHLFVSVHRKQTSRARKNSEEDTVWQRKHQAVRYVEDIAWEVYTSSGILIDFIERQRCDLLQCTASTGSADPLVDLIKLLKVQAIQDKSGFEYCGARIFQESLRTSMMRYITYDFKTSSTFPRCGIERLRQRALQMKALSQESLCLAEDVNQYLASAREAAMHMRRLKETHWDKQMRVHEFWSTFHDRSRDIWRPLVKHLPDHCDPEAGPSIPVADFFVKTGYPEDGMIAGTGSPWLTKAGFSSPNAACSFSTGALQFKASRPLTTPSLQIPMHRKCQMPSSDRFGHSAGTSFYGNDDFAKSLDRRQCFAQTFSQGVVRKLNLSQSSSQPALRSVPSTAGTRVSTANGSRVIHAGQKIPALPPVAVGRHRYLTDSDNQGNIPLPFRCVTGHSKAILAEGKDLVDSELLPIVGAVQEMQSIEAVNLKNNQLLSDASLAPLLRQLCIEPLAPTLRRLSLGNCVRAGTAAVSTVVKLIDAASMLVDLDLSHVSIPVRLQLPLCTAIGYHPRLKTVSLADVGFKEKAVTSRCIGMLLDSQTVSTLDLSWNCFDAVVFSRLGEQLVNNNALNSLRLQNCSTSTKEADPPVAFLFEHLAYDRSLTFLDVSMNHIDFRAALVIEDSLEIQKNLQEICIANNPMGLLGIRSFLRLFALPGNGLRHFNIDGCYNGDDDADVKAWEEGRKTFSPAHPGGKYVLDLAKPTHRSLLRLIYKQIMKLGILPDAVLSGISYLVAVDGGEKRIKKWEHPQKVEPTGLLQVPVEGTVALDFQIQSALERANEGALESDFVGVVNRWYELVRVKPNWRKATPILACWKQLDGRSRDQEVFLNALSKDFNLLVPHISFMCQSSRNTTNQIIWKLMPCLPVEDSTQFCAYMMFPTLQDILSTHQHMIAFADFNPDNPSGHYRLNLDNCAEHAVAERLRLLDRWEQIVDIRRKRQDVSRRNDRSHFRNEMYQGRPLWPRFPSVADWPVPESAMLEVDYVTTQRPGPNAKCLREELWTDLVALLVESPCDPGGKLKVLQSVSHFLWIDCSHMRQLIGYFRSDEHRADVFVSFFSRVVDMWNEKLFRVRLTAKEILRIRQRLGVSTVFPYLQPENSKFALDLSYHDERHVTSFLVELATKEKFENLQHTELHYPSGKVDKMVQGLPLSWVEPDALPKEGVFHCRFKCSPEDRRFEFRRKSAEVSTNFPMNVSEKELLWWSGLAESPPDVLEFLSWLITKFSDMEDAFRVASVSQNGIRMINLRQFETFLRDFGFKKFKGNEEQNRVAAVFRALDPGSSGTISKVEFHTLDQLWKEMDLCLREFMQFLTFAFGEKLEDAWKALDRDSNGSLSMEEWLQAVDHIGYLGPAEIIFQFLDTGDDNEIQFEEFRILGSYASSREEALKGHLAKADSRHESMSRQARMTMVLGAKGRKTPSLHRGMPQLSEQACAEEDPGL